MHIYINYEFLILIIQADYSSTEYYRRYLFFKYLPEVFYPFVLNHYYKKKFGRWLNLINPQRFSEKIIWSILYDKNPMKTILSDKLQAKEYVSRILPKLKFAQVYQVGSRFEDINFDKAPKSFVIKTNHSWKSNFLVEDKSKLKQEDYEKYAKYYKQALNINYAYWGTPELQYKNIVPKIYLEEYIHASEESPYIKEYEVYCFKSKPQFLNYSISVCNATDSHTTKDEKIDLIKQQCFDAYWNKTNFKIKFSNDLTAPASQNKELILEYAEKLAAKFDFVRIDFFEVGEQLYFGEFTFSPHSGFIEFYPEEYDLCLGKYLLP